MLKTRVLAALVFAPALFAAVLVGGPGLRIVCLGVTQLLVWEYQRLVLRPADMGLKALGHLLALVLPLATFGALPEAAHRSLPAAATIAVLVAVLAKPQPMAESMQRTALVALGTLWTAGLLPYLVVLRERPKDGLGLALIGLFGCWAQDTGAYFIGRRLGRRRLYPIVSPNKTLEGGIGGVLCAVLAALVLRRALAMSLDARHSAALGIVAAVAGTLGDLCESMLKRSVGKKDSSHLIPGHGGVFDRFDGVMFAVAAVWIYVNFFVAPGARV